MGKRNRERRPARRAPFADPKPTILIVCEGQVSEPEYFTGFTRAVRNPRVTIRIEGGAGVPQSVVEAAKRLKREAERQAKREKDDNIRYDFVWCVFDIDDHPNIASASQMARDSGIELAISNPSFELWLLLHFRDNPGMQHRNQITRLLR